MSGLHGLNTARKRLVMNIKQREPAHSRLPFCYTLPIRWGPDLGLHLQSRCQNIFDIEAGKFKGVTICYPKICDPNIRNDAIIRSNNVENDA